MQPALVTIVVEGSGIIGSLPQELCQATNLKGLHVSGNFISGSLPSCLAQLTGIEILRASSNNIEGALPRALSSMTSLSHIDLSHNLLSHKIPAALGLMASQLDVTKLELNRLSCELPPVWESSANFQSLALLTGGLFSCSRSMDGSAAEFESSLATRGNIYELDDRGRNYRCGNQAMCLPLVLSATATAMLLITTILVRGQQHFSPALEQFRDQQGSFWADEDLRDASRNLLAMTAGIMGVCFLAVTALLTMYMRADTR